MKAQEHQENMYKNFQSSIICNCKTLESIQISTYSGMDKLCIQTMEYSTANTNKSQLHAKIDMDLRNII